MTPQSSKTHRNGDGDFLPINGTDHVEFYVGNAKQAALFYRTTFGMSLVAYAGPETGIRDRASYVVEQGKVRFVLSSALHTEHPISDYVRKRGDGVKDIALWVDDAEGAYRETTARGARGVGEPRVLEDDSGVVRMASIATYGETIHTFVERKAYRGVFLPGYVPVTESSELAPPVGLLHIDHMVGNVGWGEMNTWVRFYQDIMGFRLYQHFDDHDISTDYSALMSKVMASGNGRIKFPINEPAHGKKRSQIEEYLDFNAGPGVQHIACATDSIVDTVGALRSRGIEFLTRSNELLR